MCGINALAYAIAKDDYVRLLTHHPLMKDTVTEIGMSPASLARSIFIGSSIAAMFALAAIAAAGATLRRQTGGAHGLCRFVIHHGADFRHCVSD